MYDIAIVGAGINGCSVAYEFEKEGKRVAIFDKEGVASGGSGAAGAFISPKFSKAGELKEILHEAFLYSKHFYSKNFPKEYSATKLLHIAQNNSDDEILKVYKERTSIPLMPLDDNIFNLLSDEAKKREYVAIQAGIVDAKSMCMSMARSAHYIQERVESLVYEDGYWVINETYSAKEVVLATGAYKSVLNEPYIELRGVWGHRVDIKTRTQNPYSLHQFVSISPTHQEILAIGATHNVHYHPEKNTQAYDVEAGRAELLQKAGQTMELKDVEVIKDYTGLRSGSFDYMPLVGPLVLSQETLACCEKQIHVKKPDFKEFAYYPHLYMINGSGGYGFVLAPYLAKMLKEHIVSAKEISPRLSPARFFSRWAKRRS
ncbi:NAD(P)/FAD-dependent oxidoreductase [Sulfurimonas sp.]